MYDVLRRYDLAPQDVLIVVDDVNLETGRLRLRRGGSDGGHNGLKSLTDHPGSRDFPRLRFGVGSPPAGRSMIDHVLGTFGEDEVRHVERVFARAAAAVLDWSRYGIECTMNQVNREDPQPGSRGSAR